MILNKYLKQNMEHFPASKDIILKETFVKRDILPGEKRPEKGYKLKSSIREIADRIQEYNERPTERYNYDMLAKIMLERADVCPEIFQNIDEWVQHKPLTPIVFGPLNFTVPYIIERRRLYGCGKRSDNFSDICGGLLSYSCSHFDYYPFFPMFPRR